MSAPPRMELPLHVLILCTGNSARSILGEALIDRLGEGRLRGASAGSAPKGQINPGALPVLRRLGFDDGAFHSKSWDVFSGPAAPPVDVVITVCDNAAGETCPLWPGTPVSAHWGLPDPADAEGDEVAPAFDRTEAQLRRRIEAFAALPLASLSPGDLKVALNRIHVEAAGTPGD